VRTSGVRKHPAAQISRDQQESFISSLAQRCVDAMAEARQPAEIHQSRRSGRRDEASRRRIFKMKANIRSRRSSDAVEAVASATNRPITSPRSRPPDEHRTFRDKTREHVPGPNPRRAILHFAAASGGPAYSCFIPPKTRRSEIVARINP